VESALKMENNSVYERENNEVHWTLDKVTVNS